MKAQILRSSSPIENRPLELVELPIPQVKAKEILVKVSVCGVCHTELDEVEGRVQPKFPIVLGHEIIGRVEDEPPQKVNCAIDFTPVGETVPQALRVLEKGGRLVLAVIRKRSPIPPLDYARLLWDEREIKSVANVTREDVQDFLSLAVEIPIIPEIQEFTLEEANEALLLLKQGKIRGAAVLRMG